MNVQAARELIAKIKGFEVCNDKALARDGDYVRVNVGDMSMRLDGLFTEDQLEALAFWMRNPGLFAEPPFIAPNSDT